MGTVLGGLRHLHRRAQITRPHCSGPTFRPRSTHLIKRPFDGLPQTWSTRWCVVYCWTVCCMAISNAPSVKTSMTWPVSMLVASSSEGFFCNLKLGSPCALSENFRIWRRTPCGAIQVSGVNYPEERKTFTTISWTGRASV